jgi:8-oxo-dGTP pyrophosphatase MutT (NUDIX family)
VSPSDVAEIPVRAAATALLLRDAADGPEILLVKRASALVFHGGAWVFPGGRVEPEDFAVLGREPDVRDAARRAAVRETAEEAGIVLSPEELVCFSHWTTPAGRPRRFATWFFVARVDAGSQVVVDGGEICAHRWLHPLAALAAQARAEIDLPPPTFVSISALADAASVAEVLARARAQEPPAFEPRLRPIPGGEVSLYRGDAAYDGAAIDAPGPRHRLWSTAGVYRYERSSA